MRLRSDRKIKNMSRVQNGILRSFLGTRPAIFLSYWVFQGILIARPVEKILKLSFDLIGTLVFYNIIASYFSLDDMVAVLISWFIAHSMNMVFNGHVWTLALFMGAVTIRPGAHKEYIYDMRGRWEKRSCAQLVLLYGSLTRGQMKLQSDLDVRVVSQGGRFDDWSCAWWVFIERAHAALKKYPIDIYVETDKNRLSKVMRADERPVALVSNLTADNESDIYRAFDKEVEKNLVA